MIPANVTSDLTALDTAITQLTTDQAQNATNQAAATASAAAVATDQAAVQTADTQLLTDLAAWVNGPTPPQPAELKTVFGDWKTKKGKIKVK